MYEKAAEELHRQELSKLDRIHNFHNHIWFSGLCIIYMFKVYKDLILTYRDKFYNILYLAYE